MSPCPAEKQGLEISEVSRQTFLDFVRRHATSEEITTAWKCAYFGAAGPLKLQCALCKNHRKQGRLWCRPSPGATLPQAVSANNAAAVSS